MRFAVPHLRSLSKATRELTARERTALSALLHRRQPDFCEIIDEVGMDPRCVEAHRFCTTFCALAFRHAEGAVGYRLARYPGHAIQEAAGFIARDDEARIGKGPVDFGSEYSVTYYHRVTSTKTIRRGSARRSQPSCSS